MAEPKLTLDSVSLLKFAYTVTDAPLTFRIPPRKGLDLEIDPESIEIGLRLADPGDDWEVVYAVVCGLWRTNQGDFSQTTTVVHFMDPLGLKAAEAPKWVRDACVATLDNLNHRWKKEG